MILVKEETYRLMGQNSETDPIIYFQLIFNKDVKAIQW